MTADDVNEVDGVRIGVNRGSLGFLTTFTAEEAHADFGSILEGRFRVDPRALLECTTPEGTGLALNDVLIKDQAPSRITRLEVYADDELVTDFFCDGLIFSTPARTRTPEKWPKACWSASAAAANTPQRIIGKRRLKTALDEPICRSRRSTA